MPHWLMTYGPDARDFVWIAVIEERLFSNEIRYFLDHCGIYGLIIIDDYLKVGSPPDIA